MGAEAEADTESVEVSSVCESIVAAAKFPDYAEESGTNADDQEETDTGSTVSSVVGMDSYRCEKGTWIDGRVHSASSARLGC